MNKIVTTIIDIQIVATTINYKHFLIIFQ